MSKLRDVQNERDTRNIPINKVGISDVSYPISVLDRENQIQHTVATVNMFVDLPHHYRGTHMSRFLEVLERHSVSLSLPKLEEILDDMKSVLDCEAAHLELSFPYFLKRTAPSSQKQSLMEYFCSVKAEKKEQMKLSIEVKVPVHNLCPCSKEISRYGAHNQRGEVTITISTRKLVWFEELIDIAESSASAPLFTLLKREDEKAVTEMAYDNPRFVEDCARESAIRLDLDARIESYSVVVKNFESIHPHNAYACIQRDNKKEEA